MWAMTDDDRGGNAVSRITRDTGVIVTGGMSHSGYWSVNLFITTRGKYLLFVLFLTFYFHSFFVNYKFKFIQHTFPVIQMQKILTLDDIKICEFERVKWVYWEKYVIGRGWVVTDVMSRHGQCHCHRPASHSHIPTLKTFDKNLIKLPWHIITFRDNHAPSVVWE